MDAVTDARVLLVDDSEELLALLTAALHEAGYRRVDAARSVAQARARFDQNRPDLMVLDVGLPDGDGFSLFTELRAKADVPALFLSARDADEDRLFGLGLGADDYLAKPFLTRELLLRMQSILRRAYRPQGRPQRLTLGEVTVDLRDAQVSSPRGETALTATELSLLCKLAEERGHIVTFDALCERVWGAGYYGFENALNVHMRHLREKLEEHPSKPRWIVTARGLGYKLAKE